MNTFEQTLARTENKIPVPRIGGHPMRPQSQRTNMDSLVELVGPNVAKAFCGTVAFGFVATGHYYLLNTMTVMYSALSNLF